MVFNADSQGFVNFPNGTEINSPPGSVVSTNGKEIKVFLGMTGATPTRVSLNFFKYIYIVAKFCLTIKY